MTQASEELTRRTEHHNEMLEYELANYERAKEVGSLETAERALGRAANHAAICLTLANKAPPTKENDDV